MNDPERDVNRAARASRLIADELLKEAFETLERDYLEAWRGTGARDTDARERLWQAIQVVGKVRAHLDRVVADGKLAQAELNAVAKLGERKKRFGVI